MHNFKTRTELLLGSVGMENLHNSTVAVIGLGGVGGAAVEAIVRAGVGTIILMDHDVFDVTNINRQILASNDTIGKSKVQVAFDRLLLINKDVNLIKINEFYSDDTKEILFKYNPTFIIDAIDTVTSKLNIISECYQRNVPIISCMGTGNRLDPTKFRIGKIEETKGCGCGLARIMRQETRKRGFFDVNILYSTEKPKNILASCNNGRHSPASISFCPPVAGYIIASYVINKIANKND